MKPILQAANILMALWLIFMGAQYQQVEIIQRAKAIESLGKSGVINTNAVDTQYGKQDGFTLSQSLSFWRIHFRSMLLPAAVLCILNAVLIQVFWKVPRKKSDSQP